MKILIIGLGSIGRRHLANIVSLGYDAISVVTRGRDIDAPVTIYHSLSEAIARESFDAAVLCTPTAFHAPAIIELLHVQVPRIYIEKPVSHSLEGIETISRLAASYPNRIVVGYDLHFDPGLQKARQLINENAVGNIIAVNAMVGQYLPQWRPGEDYRKGMSAKKETGGGVMLDLVHEFDYLYWLLGPVDRIGCFFTNSGTLEIETEDTAEVLLKFRNGILGTIHLDYLQRELIRTALFTGSQGTIRWDLAAKNISWWGENGKDEYSYATSERNDRFIEIMKSFLSTHTDERLTTLEQGIESLKMVVAAKEASERNAIVIMG